jgi:hypothetical protein
MTTRKEGQEGNEEGEREEGGERGGDEMRSA